MQRRSAKKQTVFLAIVRLLHKQTVYESFGVAITPPQVILSETKFWERNLSGATKTSACRGIYNGVSVSILNTKKYFYTNKKVTIN